MTPREREVAALIARGLKKTVIARRLDLSAATVSNYVRHIKQRLRLDGRPEVAAWMTARLHPAESSGRLRRVDDDHPRPGTEPP